MSVIPRNLHAVDISKRHNASDFYVDQMLLVKVAAAAEQV